MLGYYGERAHPTTASDTTRRRASLYSIFRRQSHMAATNAACEAAQTPPMEVPSEEQEHRPLMTMEDSILPEASDRDVETPVPDFNASPLSRHSSTMSRLGSRLLPESVARGLLNSGEETPAEGRALRLGSNMPGTTTSSTTYYDLESTLLERQAPRYQSNGRLSLRESIRTRTFTRTTSRRQLMRSAFPPMTGPWLPDDSQAAVTEQVTGQVRDQAPEGGSTWRRRVRLSRVRDSFSRQGIFGSSTDRGQSAQQHRQPAARPPRVTFADDSDHLLPPLLPMDNRIEVDDAPHELDAIEPETRNILSSNRASQTSGSIRRFPHGLRSRSTRLIRRGEHPPLSQVLQLAATAIAAQLSGNPQPSLAETQAGPGQLWDGSIQQFVETLQHAATAQAGENVDGDVADGNLPPVNFMRVFSFPNDQAGTSRSSQDFSRSEDALDIESRTDESENDRTVTLVLVGVRSMPTSADDSGDDNGSIGPSLDTLLQLPFLPPTNILRNGSSGALFRRSDGRSRFSTRRNSMTNFSSFPAQYESQRHQRTRSNATMRSQADTNLTPPVASMPTVLSESPPGPHPPPSTPADLRSGAATPNRRPSSASAAHQHALHNLEEHPASAEDVSTPSTPFTVARQRRRSDSEFARRPELSSGNSRRNGVVEPDSPPQPHTGRSWLIYVVGTNVAADHPAFTMPSLFTDNPTYEDMQLLSTLLGPVKPPVASQEDITLAGGLYRIIVNGAGLVAEPLDGSAEEGLTLVDGDRCLICLCDYETGEEVRQLNNCRHVYHRECIDEVGGKASYLNSRIANFLQWLTTGRNSCPMCRGQGVDEKSTTPPPAEPGPTESPVEIGEQGRFD